VVPAVQSWENLGEEVRFSSITVNWSEGIATKEYQVTLLATYDLSAVKSTQTVKYTISGDGTIQLVSSFNIGDTELPDMPRFGMRCELPVNFENLEYFGRGPHENYCDRNNGTFVGQYSSKG
jgi:beta-galactosidase